MDTDIGPRPFATDNEAVLACEQLRQAVVGMHKRLVASGLDNKAAWRALASKLPHGIQQENAHLVPPITVDPKQWDAWATRRMIVKAEERAESYEHLAKSWHQRGVEVKAAECAAQAKKFRADAAWLRKPQQTRDGDA